jgi:hypothetical protein
MVSIQQQLFMFDIKKVNTNTVPQTMLETTIEGLQIGKNSNQSLAVIFDRDLVNHDVFVRIKGKLKKLDVQP